MTGPDLGAIIAFENGELSQAGTLDLFASMIKTGLVWSFQGKYGRTAAEFIEAEYITPEGEVTDYGYEIAGDWDEE